MSKDVKILLSIVLGIFLWTGFVSSCSDKPEEKVVTGADGYTFDQKEYEKDLLQIGFVIAKDAKEFDEYRKEWEQPEETVGFSILLPDKNQCIIYIRDPLWVYQPELIGHEIAHCIWGKWHIDPYPDKDVYREVPQ